MTTIYRTEQASVLWAPETTFGQRPGGTNVWNQFGIHDTFDAPDPEIAFEPFWQVGSGRNRSKMLRGKWSMKGSVKDVRLVPNLALPVLSLPIGHQSGSAVYEGQSETDQRLKSISVQVAIRDTSGSYFIREWYGGKVGKASIDFAEGEDVRFTLDEITFKQMAHNQQTFDSKTIDKYVAGLTVPTPATSFTGNRYVFAAGRLTFFGTELLRIKSANLSIENNLEEKYYWQNDGTSYSGATQLLSDLIEGRRTYNLTVEMDFADPSNDMAMFQWLMNQSASGGSGSSNPTTGGTITFELYPIPGESEDVSGNGKLTITAGISPSENTPGAVITNGKINIPSLSSSGLVSSNWTIDVNSISITQGS